jgi:hypothetical protein
MQTKIRRQIGDSDSFMLINRTAPQWLRQDRYRILHPVSGALQLQRRLAAIAKQGKGRDDRFSLCDMSFYFSIQLCRPGPVTHLERCVS